MSFISQRVSILSCLGSIYTNTKLQLTLGVNQSGKTERLYRVCNVISILRIVKVSLTQFSSVNVVVN